MGSTKLERKPPRLGVSQLFGEKTHPSFQHLTIPSKSKLRSKQTPPWVHQTGEAFGSNPQNWKGSFLKWCVYKTLGKKYSYQVILVTVTFLSPKRWRSLNYLKGYWKPGHKELPGMYFQISESPGVCPKGIFLLKKLPLTENQWWCFFFHPRLRFGDASEVSWTSYFSPSTACGFEKSPRKIPENSRWKVSADFLCPSFRRLLKMFLFVVGYLS